MIQMYFLKLAQNNLLEDFLMILVKIMLREDCNEIPSELRSNRIDLFQRISPIIAFLLIYWYRQDQKPTNLEELITKSGLKDLLKNVKIGKAG